MNISVQINLGPDDTVPTSTPVEVLTALGGDPAKDTIGVSVTGGYTPPTPETPPVEGPLTPVP